MKKSIKILFILTFFYSYIGDAQYVPTFSIFKGFHIGCLYQVGIVEKCSTIQFIGEENPIIPLNSIGNNFGLECSYHFAKYYGFSLGFEYGTSATISFKKLVPYSSFHLGEDVFEVNQNPIQFKQFSIPLKFEFHFPISNYLFFTSNFGIRFKNISSLFIKNDQNLISGIIFGEGFYNDQGIPFNFFIAEFYQRSMKLNIDYLMNIGVYFKLPYYDILRFTFGLNISPQNDVYGTYFYPISQSYGKFLFKNNQINFQIAYIHTFQYFKAKKFIKYTSETKLSRKEMKSKIHKLFKN